MTETKLEIIGPYTPEHEGPFCTRGGQQVRLLTKTDGSTQYPIVGFIGNSNIPSGWNSRGFSYASGGGDYTDLMNAREVPVAREFWVNEYAGGGMSVYLYKEEAEKYNNVDCEIIHVREVLPGEGE